MRERLIELIILSVNGCARNWAETIADYLLEHNVAVLPCKVGNIIDTIISHNAVVAIWVDEDNHTSKRLWQGMGWAIPQEYKKLTFKRIFGAVPESIYEADTINILVEV